MDPITLAFSLAQSAPQVIKWLSGSSKAAEAAATVVDIATTVTGKATGNEALAAITGDPRLVMDFRRAVMEREADLDKAYLLDVQQARTAHASHWMPAAITIGLAIMVLALVAGLFALPTPPENKEVLYLIAGQIIGSFSAAIAYWIGSSRGSADKQADMRAVLEQMTRRPTA